MEFNDHWEITQRVDIFRLLDVNNNFLHIEKLDTSNNVFELFKKIYQLYDKVFILESLEGPKELSEMSIIGFDPEIIVTCNSRKFIVSDRTKTIQKSDITEPL